MILLNDIYPGLASFPLEELQAVILFGSVARGDANEDSDIDLLVISKGVLTEPLKNRLIETTNTWSLSVGKKIDLVISDPGLEQISNELRTEIFSDGIVLYGRGLIPPQTSADLVTYRLIAYSVSRLKPLERARLTRDLFGYGTSVRKGRKTYRYRREGALARSGGFRVDQSVLLCPASRSGEIVSILRRNRADYTDRTIFLERFEGERPEVTLPVTLAAKP